MKDTIFDFWYGNIDPPETSGKSTPQIKALMEEIDKSYDELEKRLNEEGKRLLNKHIDTYCSLHSEYTAKAFVEGFSLGVKLITEALN